VGAKAPGGDGFALVEALVSLVIVALISMLMIEGVSAGRRVWSQLDTASARGEAVDGARVALRDRIEQVFPATLFDKNPPYVDFAGETEAVTFIAPPPQAGRPAPLMRYRLAVTGSGGLQLSSISEVANPQGAIVVRDVLLRHVRSLDVAYFGASLPDLARRWQPTWEDQPTPPELVRIRVTFEPGDRRRWPDLIIRPKVTVDAECRFNPTTHGCKGRA
jgi:general secretion pathway protein J